jgi:hypothetical protein
MITAGMGSSFAMDGTHHISKVEMIGVVQVLLQTRNQPRTSYLLPSLALLLTGDEKFAQEESGP